LSSRLESLSPEILNCSLTSLEVSHLPEEARIEDFFPGCKSQKSLVNMVLDWNSLGEKDQFYKIWRFLSGCPKLEHVSVKKNYIKDLNAFVPAKRLILLQIDSSFLTFEFPRRWRKFQMSLWHFSINTYN
jgi:hypothetical protein